MSLIRALLAIVMIVASSSYVVASASSTSLRIQVTDERGVPVRDSVVEVMPNTGISGAIRFPWRMAMAQKNQQFVPRTLIVAKGSTVAFPNLDRVRHSVYSFSKAARFEIDLYGRDQTRTQRFAIAGSVKLGCNIHDQMRGYIRVTQTPFVGKTDHNGYVTLRSMPKGAAKLTVWHPQLRAPGNEMTSAVSITTGQQSRKLKVRLR